MTILVTGAFGLVGLGDRSAAGRERDRGGGLRPRHPGQPEEGRQTAGGRHGALRGPDRYGRGGRTTEPGRAQRGDPSWRPSSALCFARRGLARKANASTPPRTLPRGRELPTPPRFVQASSIAVHGARNPPDQRRADRRHPGASDGLYGAHKVETEALVQPRRWIG